MMKIKIAETAQKHGLKSAYALQNALKISPTIAARLWKGEFDKIGIKTLERLCEYFYCQPNDFLEYPLTLSGNTQSSKDVARGTQLSNTELSNDTQTDNTQSSKTESASDNIDTQLNNVELNGFRMQSSMTESEKLDRVMEKIAHPLPELQPNDFWLTTIEVAEKLGVSRKSVNDYIISGKLPSFKTLGNRNLIRYSNMLKFQAEYPKKSK